MIKSEYDNIDELVQDDIDDIDDYESAKEAQGLLMDALKLTDIQKTMLKGSYAFLEDLLRKEIMDDVANKGKKAQFARIGSFTFQYDDKAYGDTRTITGREIIEWIRRNQLEDISLYSDVECLFARMIDVENDRHYRESYIRWDARHAKYEVIDNILDE